MSDINLKGQVDEVLKGCIELMSKPPVTQELNVNENGIYTPPSGVDGFSKVNVNIPDPPLEELIVTQNGTYTPSGNNYGFSSVNVNVSIPEIEIEERRFLYDGSRWFSTGIDINANYDYEFLFSNYSGSNAFKPFIGNNNNNEGIYLFGFCATDEGTWGYGTGTAFRWNGGTITYGDHVVKYDDNLSLDNNIITSYTRRTLSGQITIGYGPNYRPATEGYFDNMKVFEHSSGTLIHDIKPIKISFNGVTYFEGIYDVLNKSVVYQCATVPKN